MLAKQPCQSTNAGSAGFRAEAPDEGPVCLHNRTQPHIRYYLHYLSSVVLFLLIASKCCRESAKEYMLLLVKIKRIWTSGGDRS